MDDTELLEGAICGRNKKLDPGEVPTCEVTGVVKMPATDGKTLLVFSHPKGTIGVRLEEEALRTLKSFLGGSDR